VLGYEDLEAGDLKLPTTEGSFFVINAGLRFFASLRMTIVYE
jgi:hypothetical protein